VADDESPILCVNDPRFWLRQLKNFKPTVSRRWDLDLLSASKPRRSDHLCAWSTGDFSMIVPACTLSEIVKILPDGEVSNICKLRTNRNQVVFSSDGVAPCSITSMVGIHCESSGVVQPAELWQESGRWYDYGAELVRLKDRGERDMVLSMTHEEVITELLRRQVRSYRQLPVVLYQIQTKFRDEPRSRGGLLRVREFVMKDAYSCHVSFEDLDAYYARMYQAYFDIFRRAGIDVIAVQADVGMMGGTMAHEFMLLTDIGEDQIVLCDSCGYAANRQIATFRKDAPEQEEQRPLEEVETPQTQTIAGLARLLDIPESRTAKAAFFMAGDRLIFAVVRGDMEVNETKLANAIAAPELRPARADELQKAGIVAGYASPIGVEGVTVEVDDLVAPRNPVAPTGPHTSWEHRERAAACTFARCRLPLSV